MCPYHDDTQGEIISPPARKRGLRAFSRSKDGAAAIEFALLAIPYFLIIFAIIETFVAFIGEQLVVNAVNEMSRRLRTGEISEMTEDKFRQAFCDEISILMKCSETEISTPTKLYLDVRQFSSFADIPAAIPRVSANKHADIDPTSFAYAPGGPGTINMMRAYYRWSIMTDLLRPYLTNIQPADGSMPTDFLIVATSVFLAETDQ